MNRSIRLVLTSILTVLAAASDSAGIIIRHDREDSRYVELGTGYRSAGALVPVGDGMATLVDPHWAITAAHVAEEISPFVRSIRFGNQVFRIDSVLYHPGWTGGEGRDSIDMALLKLARPVEGIEPVIPYKKKEELGQRVVFVGWGDTGNGRDGPKGNDGKKRAAHNTVSGVEENWITFRFDSPPDGDDLEGISGPGDSGGPALLEVKKKAFLLGVGSGNDDGGQGLPECTYGTTEYYARVSPHVEWIQDAIKNDTTGKTFGPVAILADSGWPETPAGKVARAFFGGFASGDDAELARFEKTYRTPEALEQRSVGARVDNWNRFRERSGRLVPDRYVEFGPDDLSVLVRAERAGHWLRFRFRLEQAEPPKMNVISITPEMEPPN